MKTRKHSFITIVMTMLLAGTAALVFATSAKAGTAVKPEAALSDYQFPYHIPDERGITAAERDERIKKMEQEIFGLFQNLEFEDQIGFEHIDEAEYDILLNDSNTSGITVNAMLLAYGEDGSPLRLRWNFLDSSEPESFEYLTWSGGSILPGDTQSLPGGWSIYDSGSTYGLEPPGEEYKVEYVLMGVRQIEFEDGSTWLNPDFEGWLADHKGKETDPEILKGYYPFDCVIFPERRPLDDEIQLK